MESKPENHVKVGAGSSVRSVITYCTMLLKEKNFREINFSAIGGAIGGLVNVIEVLKIQNAGLYQNNKLGTVVYQTVDSTGKVSAQRLFPKLEVLLSFDEPKEKGEGYQTKLSEEERTKLLEAQGANRKEGTGYGGPREGQRDGFRGGSRGGFRGSRGGPRGRGGFRGSRGGYGEDSRGGYGEGSRGGYRGSRGGYGEQSRGGYRNSRSGYGEESRGGYRGSRGGYGEESRGGFRGSRGGFRGTRGGSRGGFRGAPRQEREY
jgi:hypothetical protein